MSDSELPYKEDDEVSIPRAALNKLIKDIVPDARISTDARELVLSCAHEFIHHIATRSNEACGKASKKTINPEHVLEALKVMGMSSYEDTARMASEEAKVQAKTRRLKSASYKFKNQQPEDFEKLQQLQEQMFQQARAQLELEQQMDKDELHLAAQEAANMASLNALHEENSDDDYDD